MYKLYGDSKKLMEYLEHAKELHEMMDRDLVTEIYSCIDRMVGLIKVPDEYRVPIFRSRKQYLNHYRKEIELLSKDMANSARPYKCR